MSVKAKQALLWLVVISSSLLFVYFLQSNPEKSPQDLTVDSALTRIQNKDFKEAYFRRSQVEFKDLNDAIFVTTLGSDLMREKVLKAVIDFNAANESSSIKISEEAAWNGWGWVVLINSLPLLSLFILCMVVAFYVGRASNRNKG